MDPADRLRQYESLHAPATSTAPPLARVARRALPGSRRLWARQVATNLQAPVARRRAGDARSASLRLHLGCGEKRLPGWVNVDLVGAAADVHWDLRRPLPFPDGSADAVFLEHVFEHMTYGQVVAVLHHVHAVLRPGGGVRVGVPDAGLYARAYVEDRALLATLRAGRPTPMLALREVFQEHGHLSAFDAETLTWVLRAGGFADAVAVEAGRSTLWPSAPDSPDRVAETVYAEATRAL